MAIGQKNISSSGATERIDASFIRMMPTMRLSCRCFAVIPLLLALVAAGLLWGLTVPLSKLALEWLEGGWLTVARFALAAPLLAFVARRHLRAALTPRIVFAGAVGYGLVIVLQNAGIERTSVSHASLIVGAVPALVALAAAVSGRGSDRVRRPGSASRWRSAAWRSWPAAAGGARLAGRRRARAGVGDAVGDVRRRPAVAAARARPDRGDRGADGRGRARGCAQRGARGAPGRAVRRGAGRRRCSRSRSPARSRRSRCSPTGSRAWRRSSPGRSSTSSRSSARPRARSPSATRSGRCSSPAAS